MCQCGMIGVQSELLMWNVITSNRILELKMRREAYRKHKKAIKEVKPLVDITAPQKFVFLGKKLKSKMIAQDEEREIENQNQNLLRRMIEQKKKLRPSSAQHFPKESLNQPQFRRTSDRINSENKRLLLKLSDTSASINFQRMQQQHRAVQKIKTNISRSRPKSGMATNRTHSARPMSAR